MLPKPNRLRRKKDFEMVKTKGKSFQGELFGLLVYPTREKLSHFGFIISTKISPRATQRNRVRRQLGEAVKKLLPQITGGFNVVFLAKKTLLGQSLSTIQTEAEKLFLKANLLRK